MKLLYRSLIYLSLALMFTINAHASLLIEPLAGFNVGSKLDFENGEKYSYGTGGAFGGRLGYQKLGFQLGVDYLNSSIDLNDDDFDENVSMSEWAGFIGFRFPLFLRVYAGYIFSANGESKVNNIKEKYIEGSGSKIGIGFTGLPFIDINFEFRSGKFDNFERADVEQDKAVNYQSVLIGVSLPITI